MAKSEVYNNLPGIEVPVGDALKELSSMWNAPVSSNSRSPSEFRASRMNLILHLGFDCSHEDANEVFQNVIDFSRRYPCRIVILCAQPDSWNAESGMVCKIYSQCDIGLSGSDMNCCEVLTLGYTLGDRKYLESQVSLFLETDLPVYYWPVQFDSASLLSDYQFFFKRARRIIFDTSRERFDIGEVDIPQPDKLRDVAYARVLSARQSIGQFLSSFSVEQILDGLEAVAIVCPDDRKAESKALLDWIESALDDCYESGARSVVRFDEVDCQKATCGPKLVFHYGNTNRFECSLSLDSGQAKIEAHYSGESYCTISGFKLLEPTEALAEALFFS